ncbi:isoprenylcysteine carboxylmethyltransferase family protein [Alloalcanivorax mobilis]|uniref:isoprenylcysteine carboxylmethyltransferase family protein n=1 Tax=Alloalcanivorax mobilis TaxID=2019569 RepID=UPI000B5B35CD|nr:isoprenylcysteine carboxylmethyltransferase family protein [Alloalcanivorax mobilis]ASK33047.1 isoprenylcysteine carboxyl methyltransferase [Alcanivorax sp. N3-2A]ASK36865.1 isoprenylcysteine carboxyl methyltransferase [Alcanivorax sp. N3-2A]
MTENAAELVLVLMTSASLLLHWLGVRRPVRARHRPAPPLDVEQLVLVTLVAITMVVIPLLDNLVPWFEFADFMFLDEFAWFGLMLGAAAVWLFWRANSDWASRHPGDGTTVMDRGVYRYLRHPVYAAMLLWSLAQLLLLQNWLAGPAAALTFILVYLLRVPVEEQQRLERHGHRYLDYMERTGAIVPRFTRQR